MNDRDFVSVRGRAIRRTTAVRDWVCGVCGSRLVTRWSAEPPHWQTVCFAEPMHEQDEFVHKQAWAWMEHRRLTEAAEAEDVLDHLPPELQAAIAERS